MHEAELYPGMDNLIKQLAGAGHELYIVSTNSRSNIQKFLAYKGLNHYFKRVYGGLGARNKARLIKQIVRKSPDKAVDEVYYIGDEDRDILAGQAANVQTVAVMWGYNSEAQLMKQNPMFTASSAAEIGQLFEVSEA
jgi:phosphoglycolate phosphatase